MTVQEARSILSAKAGLEKQTLDFLELYKYGDQLLIKMAKAVK